MNQKRLVVKSDDLISLQKIADVTRCGSLSAALSLLISKYGDEMIKNWGNSTTASHYVQPPVAPPTPATVNTVSSFIEPLDF